VTSASSRLTVRGPDLGKLSSALASVAKLRLVVGVQGSEAADLYEAKEGARPLTLVEVASVHEFGTKDGRIPERSFLRSTLTRREGNYGKLLTAALQRSLEEVSIDGVGDVAGAFARQLEVVGLRVVRDVQTTIRDSGPGWPANAPITVLAKGSSKPLIDTGRLRQSIRHAVRVAP
jgi:hypothetical protein